ncbi:MAG: hypothetical protein QMD65_00210 [Patescibacteria group bacterium]|nr:hypothetical protein [Patescibacteria group bacterium]
MKKINIALIILIGWLINLISFKNVSATTTIELPNPINATSTIAILNSILAVLQTFAHLIVVIMVLIGAFQILFAAGDPEKFSKGKKTILYSVIGYAIVLVAGGITSFIADFLQ